MNLIKRLLQWLLSLFETSLTPDLDKLIEEKREKVKELDKKISKDYEDVESAKEEW